jgi:hypothetical protein
MNTSTPSRTLSPDEVDAFGRELDALRHAVIADLGQRDVDHIRGVIRAVRYTEVAGRALLHFGVGPVSFALWPGQMVKVVQGHHLPCKSVLLVGCPYFRKNHESASLSGLHQCYRRSIEFAIDCSASTLGIRSNTAPARHHRPRAQRGVLGGARAPGPWCGRGGGGGGRTCPTSTRRPAPRAPPR